MSKEQNKVEKASDYDRLQCPDCDKVCKPVKVRKNGTVVYEKHDCNSGEYSFEIDIEGNLVE